MLPKKNRADRKDVDKIFKDGKFLNSSSLTFKFILNKNFDIPRISFIAPKSVAKLAVRRNFLRRHGYSVLKKYSKDFPLGLVGAFIFKKGETDSIILENEIKNILSKFR